MVLYVTRFGSDTVEAPIKLQDLPEQAQWELQNRHSLRTILEVQLTEIVARNRKFIWWLTVFSCLGPLVLFIAVE